MIGLTVLASVLFGMLGALLRLGEPNDDNALTATLLVLLPIAVPMGAMVVFSLAIYLHRWLRKPSRSRDR